jgi:hypothetical protein
LALRGEYVVVDTFAFGSPRVHQRSIVSDVSREDGLGLRSSPRQNTRRPSPARAEKQLGRVSDSHSTATRVAARQAPPVHHRRLTSSRSRATAPPHTPPRTTAHATARQRATARATTRQRTRHRPQRHRATTPPRARAAEEQKSYEALAVRRVAACAPKPRFPPRRHRATARSAASRRCSASRSGLNLSRGAGNSCRVSAGRGAAPRRFSPPLHSGPGTLPRERASQGQSLLACLAPGGHVAAEVAGLLQCKFS